MVRMARIVLPGITHYVTQRGNGQQQTFLGIECTVTIIPVTEITVAAIRKPG
jgi:hypothetical protein